MDNKRLWTWARKHSDGYECSSKGDKRFSAFSARLYDGRTIESWYQCDIKGYSPGGSDWRLGKGKPTLMGQSPEMLYNEYRELWEMWAQENIDLMRELYTLTKEHRILTDCFATSPINQARALSDIMNRLVYGNIINR